MKLIIFGATGMVGKQLVQQALFGKNMVKAFGRNVYTTDYLPTGPGGETENLELVQGALFDEGEVYNAIKGCDAVLSAIGGSADGTDKTRTLGMKNIIKQMQKAGVKRIIAIGGLGVLNSEAPSGQDTANENSLLVDKDDYPAEYKAVGFEHKKAYELLNESGLDWTFVCPPNIMNDGPTGSYATKAAYPPDENKYKINAGDLAMFMLKELEKNEYVKQRVGISN
ncbi:MAG: NAD(P)-dependent oxidoreductase [Ferruginibacter sp.]